MRPRERWEDMRTLEAREGYQKHNRACYPREFWLVQHVEPPPVSSGLRTIVAWAAFFVTVAVWAFAFFGGL